MILPKLIAPVLVLAAGLIHIAIQEKWKGFHDRRTKRHKYVMATLVVVMVAGSIVTGVTVSVDTTKNARLQKDVQNLSRSEEERESQRAEKLTLVAERVRALQADGNTFLMTFLGGLGRQDLVNQFNLHYTGDPLQRYPLDQLRKQLEALIMSTTMLEPSCAYTRKKTGDSEVMVPIPQIAFFYSEMRKAHSEAESILQHYGDVDHELIRIVDELRQRAALFIWWVPTLEKCEGGALGVLKDGVPKQHAEFIADYFVRQYRAKMICDDILNAGSNKAAGG